MVCPRRGRVNEKNWVDHNRRSTLYTRTLTRIADASGQAQEAHSSIDARFRCAASVYGVGTEADAVLPKPTKITCGLCADATRAIPPWYFVAGTVGIVGIRVTGAL